MARPIEATPTLTGEDAEKLQASIARVASPEEIERRRRAARQFYNTVTKPKNTVTKPKRAQGGASDEGNG
jgi:hypothetical protein